MSLMAQVDSARSSLQGANNSLSGARGSVKYIPSFDGLEYRVKRKLLELAAVPGEAINEVLDGAEEKVKEELGGLWDAVTNPIETGKDAWAGVQEAIDDPGQAAKEAWDDFTEPYVEDWENGREGEAIGRGLVEGGQMLIPGWGAVKAGKMALDVLKGLGKDSDGGDSGDESPGGDPPSAGSDGPGDDPPGDDPPSTGSDEPDDDDGDSDKDDESGDDDSNSDEDDGPAKDAALEGAARTPDKQLDHVYDRHAEDFGVDGNRNKETREQLRQAIADHLSDSGTEVIKGTYKGETTTHFYNPETGLNVFLKPDGSIWSGWRLSSAQANHLTTHGNLK